MLFLHSRQNMSLLKQKITNDIILVATVSRKGIIASNNIRRRRRNICAERK